MKGNFINKCRKNILEKEEFRIRKILKFICVILVIIAITYSKVEGEKEKERNYLKAVSMQTSVSSEFEQLSTQKKAWGIKRGKNEKQPELGKENKELIEKYNGIAIGNEETKNIYLTFDNGYENGYTEKILDILKEKNVKAAFFATGHYIKKNENIVKRMIDEGHILGNHTYSHRDFTTLSVDEIKDEILKMNALVYEKFGYEMKYIRMPKGEFNERTLAVSQSMGYRDVMWSFAYDDWVEKKQRGKDYAVNKIIENLHPGEIMLLHAVSKDNLDALGECIDKAREKGYEFKSLDEF